MLRSKLPLVGVSEVRTKNECHPERSWARFLRPTESKDLRFKRHKYAANFRDRTLDRRIGIAREFVDSHRAGNVVECGSDGLGAVEILGWIPQRCLKNHARPPLPRL